MRPFAPQGPYYAILLSGGTLDTCGGPVIDDTGSVLRPAGERIGGLFGAGNCVASPTGQAYWSAGSTLGPALTFGYLAGTAAAAAPVRDD
jgi:succinate dehydrogenase/fumarate reductase flavoprotein subunit